MTSGAKKIVKVTEHVPIPYTLDLTTEDVRRDNVDKLCVHVRRPCACVDTLAHPTALTIHLRLPWFYSYVRSYYLLFFLPRM